MSKTPARTNFPSFLFGKVSILASNLSPGQAVGLKLSLLLNFLWNSLKFPLLLLYIITTLWIINGNSEIIWTIRDRMNTYFLPLSTPKLLAEKQNRREINSSTRFKCLLEPWLRNETPFTSTSAPPSVALNSVGAISTTLVFQGGIILSNSKSLVVTKRREASVHDRKECRMSLRYAVRNEAEYHTLLLLLQDH